VENRQGKEIIFLKYFNHSVHSFKLNNLKSQKFDPNKETGNETFLSGTERPLNWRTDVHKLGTADDDLTYRHLSGSSGVGFRNEDFIVWMRTAAFPTFRKLYRKIQDNGAGKQSNILTVKYEILRSSTW